jgi:hypothetical protein
MAKHLAKKQRTPSQGQKDARDATVKDKIIDNFLKRFEQISEQYDLASPSTKRTLRMVCMYSELIEGVGNGAIEAAPKSMSNEEIVNVYKQIVTRIRDAGDALLVWWRKVGWTPLKPELTKAQSRQAAEIAAYDMKASAPLISVSALQGDEWFFICLGKYLSGEMTSTFPEKLDFHMWYILRGNPSIKSPDAVRELEKHGFKMTEEAFRMRKKRMGFAEFKRFRATG